MLKLQTRVECGSAPFRMSYSDGIVLLGDLFPSEFEKSDEDDVIGLTQGMQDIAQVFFAMGNHEKKYTTKYGDDWIDRIRDTGAIVFDEECKDVVLKGWDMAFFSAGQVNSS